MLTTSAAVFALAAMTRVRSAPTTTGPTLQHAVAAGGWGGWGGQAAAAAAAAASCRRASALRSPHNPRQGYMPATAAPHSHAAQLERAVGLRLHRESLQQVGQSGGH